MAIPPLRTVLAATDFSGFGDYCVPRAYSLLPSGGVVHLVHVIEPEQIAAGLYTHFRIGHRVTDDERMKEKEALGRRLGTMVPNSADERDVETRLEVVEGRDPAEAIVAAADRLDVDVIVVGSHGYTGLLRVMVGSVTQGVLARTRRPVLVVRPPLAL